MEPEIPYILEFKKKRSSSATIRDGKIVLRISSLLPKYAQAEHIEVLLRKMAPVLEKVQNHTHLLQDLSSGMIIVPWDGIPTALFTEEPEVRSLKKKQPATLAPKALHTFLLKWSREQWTVPVTTLMFAWKNKMDLHSKQTTVYFKNLKSKWGMCSSRGEITLAIKTLFLPYHLFEYVLIHELAHLKHMNHSASFWQFVETFLPNHKELRKELRTYH